jgi:hypothetical protein
VAAAAMAVGSLALAASAAAPPASGPTSQPAFWNWAATPPMGWNSWDCYGTAVTEAQTKANADYMADKLAKFGWQYIVVDIQWYEPGAKGHDYRKGARLTMDEYGRLLPAPNKFPSAVEHGQAGGFSPLSSYIHSKGLKFGIHLMRGIPRQAVEQNTPILGTPYRARDIANTNDTCPWNPDMYGVDMSKPGAQAYYNSVFDLIASWGVDFVKVDDLSRPYFDHVKEIEAVRAAIDRAGRPIVLSTSPGETPIEAGEHVSRHANLWRISDDFWDNWKALLEQFDRCAKWAKYTGPGHWPDADMLPLGAVRIGQKKPWTNFTRDEQVTLMTLWCICRSPLMFGGDLPRNDEWTLKLITNEEVLAVNQHSTNGRELSRKDGLVIWQADVPGSRDVYYALFNQTDKPVEYPLAQDGKDRIRDLWEKRDVTSFPFKPVIPPHGAELYHVSPAAGAGN